MRRRDSESETERVKRRDRESETERWLSSRQRWTDVMWRGESCSFHLFIRKFKAGAVL